MTYRKKMFFHRNIFFLIVKIITYGLVRFALKKIVFLLFLFVSFAFCDETLCVYRFDKENKLIETPVGELNKADWIRELPIPKEKVKKITFVNDEKNKKKKKRVVTWVLRDPKEPPEYVPIDCRFGTVFTKRAELARFKQESLDLSGEYASSTGSIFLKKSPNNPKHFNVIIQNGPATGRAELEMGDLEIRENKGFSRLSYSEDGCTVDIGISNRQVKVVQRGCSEYNVGDYKLEGTYSTYKGNSRTVETFGMPEQQFKFKKYLWCDSGFDSCEKTEDENGAVYITWSKGGNGFIERKAGETVHLYRPFESMIPHKRDFYKGEKPIVIKTKRTDMAGEWMIWYFYPKAERFKMVRANMREETAYMEIYE